MTVTGRAKLDMECALPLPLGEGVSSVLLRRRQGLNSQGSCKTKVAVGLGDDTVITDYYLGITVQNGECFWFP